MRSRVRHRSSLRIPDLPPLAAHRGSEWCSGRRPTRPHRSGGAWSGTVAVTPRASRPMGLSGRICLALARVRLRAGERSSHALPQSVDRSIARRFCLNKSPAVTTQELETLADTVSRLAASRSRCDRSRRLIWHAWRDDLVGRFHRTMKPTVRPYAGKMLVQVAASLLADLERAWRWADELDDLTDELDGELAVGQAAVRQTPARTGADCQSDGGVGARAGAGPRQPGPPAGRYFAGAAGAEDHRRVADPARDACA